LRNIWGKRLIFLILLGGCATFLNPSTRQFDKAVVMRVEKSEPTLPYRGRRADSPPPPTEFDYELTLRVNGQLYVGLYQSAIDYLPSAVAPNRSVEVRVERHVMYVRAPGAGEIKMGIVRHYSASTASCSSGR
jgi:hypothetical protein